jgi:hypothetical protein
MPFNLDATTHVFQDLDDGGVQKVVANVPADRQQIDLIRQHLSHEAERFARGDFSDPARIHGQDMPGLAEMRSGAARMDIRYSPLPDGGEIRYRTTDAKLVEAVHRWFAAQRHDHGPHAAADPRAPAPPTGAGSP